MGWIVYNSCHTFHWLDLDPHQDSGAWILINCHHHANELPRRSLWCHMVSGDTVHLIRSITAYDSYYCFREAGLNRLEVHHPEFTRNSDRILWDEPIMPAPCTNPQKKTGFECLQVTWGIHIGVIPWLLRCLKPAGVNVFIRSVLEYTEDWTASVLTALETRAGSSF